MTIDVCAFTIAEAGRLFRAKELSSIELTRAYLDRIEAVDSKIQALMTVTGGVALNQAKKADAILARGEGHPLTGIPIILKDVLCTKGIRTTCSSKMLQNFIPPYDAAVVERLHACGAVIIGKSNMDEFAMGSSTENSAYFTTRNPWDTSRVPGGSSGGSAAAVAAGLATAALGSDTGGSIRQPAAFCSVVGLKPTYGLVSRYGLIAFASSLDQIGPFTKDVADTALMLNAIAGYDPRDSTSVPQPETDYHGCLGGSVKGMRIGVPKEYLAQGVTPEVKAAVDAALKVYEDLGCSIEECSLPTTDAALAVYYIIAPSEASANLARYDGVKYGFSYKETDSMWQAMEKTRAMGFGPEVKRRIMLGTYALSAGYYDAWYVKAQKVRTVIRREFDAAFERYDALITPTAPTVPFKIGEKAADPFSMYLSDICTIPVNIAGLPGISIQGGFHNNLPIGLQIIGKPFAEKTILKLGHAFQQVTDWHLRQPQL
ncbi:Asp-tRNA(Asn)/Glu-tRNA(Gln) amidotransferase subunit GatA [Dehalogenimonas alkenigignens]|uniref:Glutamyl-tRNA(Gln) amidotransferase subunit A n=1 Tax=Dehalogenimonas alkenigignens TaxID=1217799 RepID=A0A0W0GG27_9CHLR|nr:Asp-tRNA(Asn)/Glu-tRNA(Gln) amidotransferase subunit GatA [Dehalogenimonas alkenigignens]KTB47509.1 aspartyl/glutamyl-tRNA(Asn/Gln) amidotransferase subunit A [Dehalogenimonas alkenigignens]PVV83434.1 Asp-tRNA(Asn)/Glu-tRNA(Gln) amidotransferase subunit GatA [Dehalogenimonas alkenigignens]